MEDSPIYADPDEKEAFDILERGSIVKILMESEDGFVRVDFNGDSFYIKTSALREI